MILNGDEIIEAHRQGEICIDPWNEDCVGTNSYDIALHSELVIYTTHVLDPKNNNPSKKIILPEDGFILWPCEFILGATAETVANPSNELVPMIEGRSSIARLGLSIHETAGFGDIGFAGRWTLEISCRKPIKLYPGMPIGQLYWIRTHPTDKRYRGRYQDLTGVGASRLYKDFEK